MRRLAIVFGALALALSGATVVAPSPAATQTDWTRTIVATPEGGFRMGNPDAPVKLVEYLSLTCPHCAQFAAESEARLFSEYVRSGRVSVEYRNYILSAPDLAAAILSRCAAPRAYFAMSQELLRTQTQWAGRMNGITEAQRAELRPLAPLELARRLVPLLGLDRVGARHGLTTEAQRTCLTTQANFDRLEGIHRTASTELGVAGTPTFFINGVTVNANSWSGIEPLLRASQ